MYMAMLNFSVIAVNPGIHTQLALLAAQRPRQSQKRAVLEKRGPQHARTGWSFLELPVAGQASDTWSPLPVLTILGVRERLQESAFQILSL